MDLHFAEAGAPVPPIQIECHLRDSAASTPPPPRGYCFAEVAARVIFGPKSDGTYAMLLKAKGQM
jgi:hypothetical protein